MNQKEIKIGDIVKYIGNRHDDEPEYYPTVGTTGVVKYIDDYSVRVQWEEGSTSREDRWYCDKNDVELVKDEDMTNEEIWEMLKSKMEKNNWKGTKMCNIPYSHWTEFCNTKWYKEDDVHNAIALAYKVGYLRSQKGRPFKIGGNKTGHSESKKEKTGHWVPVDPNNLPKEGTKVRYSRESKEYSIEKEPMIAVGDVGEFSYGKILGLPGIRFNDGRFWNWVSFSNEPECLDMWVEDDE